MIDQLQHSLQSMQPPCMHNPIHLEKAEIVQQWINITSCKLQCRQCSSSHHTPLLLLLQAHFAVPSALAAMAAEQVSMQLSLMCKLQGCPRLGSSSSIDGQDSWEPAQSTAVIATLVEISLSGEILQCKTQQQNSWTFDRR
jgi:hypothetical protein